MNHLIKLNFLCLLCVFNIILIKDTHGQKACGDYDWKCKNGECIASDEHCDGKKDCTDGSDETAESCLYVHCPSFSYRCSYGGCANGDAECNGVKDCADNSDETSISCPGVLESIKMSGNCSEDSFQCDLGDCISNDNLCDGIKHCQDGSDETLKVCSRYNCPSYAFRCGYGACVDGTAKCDGVIDCADGSDESVLLCGGDHTIESTNLGGPTEKPTKAPVTHVGMRSGCKIDNLPSVIVSYDATGEVIPPGKHIADGVAIAYKCRPKHILDGAINNYCLNGQFISKHPTCTKRCPNIILQGVTFQAYCEYNRQIISCNELIRPKTRAYLSCKIGYQKPDTDSTDVIVCDENGEWDFTPYRCKAECGQQPVDATPFIYGGEKVNNSKVPWNVGIYRNKGDRYEHICGGTILSQKIVISAAHCFWDVKYETAQDKRLFAVAAGKYYRDYYTPEKLSPQFFNVEELHINDGYRDVHLSYYNDIAVLILDNYITYNSYIKPICIEYSSYDKQQIEPNLVGKVAGWGKVSNEGNPSVELRVIDLPTVDIEQCKRETLPEYRNYITNDKFCVNHIDGETVCEGDSGGGFAIPKIVGGVKTYYLTGIVSVGLNTKRQCGGNYFTTFTNIQFHQRMLINYETKYRPK